MHFFKSNSRDQELAFSFLQCVKFQEKQLVGILLLLQHSSNSRSCRESRTHSSVPQFLVPCGLIPSASQVRQGQRSLISDVVVSGKLLTNLSCFPCSLGCVFGYVQEWELHKSVALEKPKTKSLWLRVWLSLTKSQHNHSEYAFSKLFI